MTEENFEVMAKKNFGRSSRTNNINSAMGFTYPQRHNGKTIYVDFYVFDPASGEKKRIKKHFDNIKNKREREAAISHYMAVISQKLRQGWNPLAECGNKGLTTIELVFEKYENSLLQYSRKKTIQNYTSRLNILKEYIRRLRTHFSEPYLGACQFLCEANKISIPDLISPRFRLVDGLAEASLRGPLFIHHIEPSLIMYQPDDGPGLVHEDEDVAVVIRIAPHLCLHYVEQSHKATSEVHLACVKTEPQFLSLPKHSAGLSCSTSPAGCQTLLIPSQASGRCQNLS